MVWFPAGVVSRPAPAAGGIALLDSWAITSTTDANPGDFTVSSGSNRLLLLAVNTRTTNAAQLTAVTYGGQSMTLTEAAVIFQGPDSAVSFWFLNGAGIAAASNSDFGFTFNTTPVNDQLRAVAGSYTGVDQASPLIDSFTNAAVNGDDPPITALTSVDGALIAAVYCANRGTSDTPTVEDASYVNLTEAIEVEASQSYLSVGTGSASGVSFTIDASLTHQTAAHIVGAAFRPAA